MTKDTSVVPPDGATTDPSDEPLTTAMAERRESGDDRGDGQFQAAADGEILCLTCRNRFPADSQRADDIDRFEGASDPADMAMVLPVRCPRCSTSGTLIVRYGPEASADESDLLLGLRRDPADHGRPPAT